MAFTTSPFAAIILGREIHLVPDLLDLDRRASFEKAGEMLLDDIGGGSPPRSSPRADVPSSASISTTSVPSTLMPKLCRDWRYSG
jgi:hypothetical protein